jgi:hypothetical protein
MSDGGEFSHDVLLARVAVTLALPFLGFFGNFVR